MSKFNIIVRSMCDIKVAFYSRYFDAWVLEAEFAGYRNAHNYAQEASRNGLDRVVIDDGKVMYYFRNGDRVASEEEN